MEERGKPKFRLPVTMDELKGAISGEKMAKQESDYDILIKRTQVAKAAVGLELEEAARDMAGYREEGDQVALEEGEKRIAWNEGAKAMAECILNEGNGVRDIGELIKKGREKLLSAQELLARYPGVEFPEPEKPKGHVHFTGGL